jgi:hypothetical protein
MSRKVEEMKTRMTRSVDCEDGGIVRHFSWFQNKVHGQASREAPAYRTRTSTSSLRPPPRERMSRQAAYRAAAMHYLPYYHVQRLDTANLNVKAALTVTDAIAFECERDLANMR